MTEQPTYLRRICAHAGFGTCPACQPTPRTVEDAARAALNSATHGDSPSSWAGTPWWHVHNLLILLAAQAAQVPTVDALARLLFDLDHQDTDPAWRDAAWTDMGGSEPSDERAEYEHKATRIAALYGTGQEKR